MSRKMLAGVMITAALLAVGCGGTDEEMALSLPPRDGGVAVSDALASDSPAGWIRGYLVAERGQPVVLCEFLLESFPPRCGGAALILRDGVLWREPYSDSSPFGQVTPGGGIDDGVLTRDEPCGYEADGPCADLLGLATGDNVLWTEVAYSVIGTVRGSELHRLEGPPGGDL